MTVYSGKDAKVYLGDYKLPYVNNINLNETRRTLIFQDIHGDQKRYKSKPLVSGTITIHDVGMPHLSHFMPYKTVVGGSLTAKWYDDRYSIGFPHPAKCTSQTVVYNGSPTTIDLDIPSGAISDTITFKTIHLYVDGYPGGSPNSAVYTVELRELTTVRDSETFTWTTNDGRWISLTTINYNTGNNSNWNIRISTSDAGTTSTNCQRVYKIVGTEYPFFDTDTGCCILEIEDWVATEQKVNITLEVSTNHTALISGVVFGDIKKGYATGEIQSQVVPFTADDVEWVET